MSSWTCLAACRPRIAAPHRRRFGFLALAAALVLTAASSTLTRAQSITILVDSTTDAPDAAPGDGACAATGGGCTLRAAVQEANAHPGADVILLPAGTFALTLVGWDDIAAVGDLDVTDALTLRGAGADATVIDARVVEQAVMAWSPAALDVSALRILGSQLTDSSATSLASIAAGGPLKLADVTIEGGTGLGVSYGSGVPGRIERSIIRDNRSGGIRTGSPLHLVDSRVENNGPDPAAFGSEAAGIFADADLYIERSLLADNRPVAVRGTFGWAHYLVRDSTFQSNGVQGRLTAVNTTFDGPSALHLETGSALANVTLAGPPGAEVLVAKSGAISLANTAISGDCRIGATVFDRGGNVVLSSGCSAHLPAIQIVADLGLGLLSDSGGLTQTRLPAPNSPLRGAGAAPCPRFDQRGFGRPSTGPCDSGAVEADATGAGAPTPTPHSWANGPTPWSTGMPYSTPVPVPPRAAFGLEVAAQAGGASRALVLDGDRAWVSVGAWLVALDRSDPARPVELGRLLLPELIVALAQDPSSGRLAVRTTDALAVVDGTDPAHPTRVAWLPLPVFPRTPDFAERDLEGGVAVGAGGVAVVTGDDNQWDGDGRMAVWVATIGIGAPPRWRAMVRPGISFGQVGPTMPPLDWPVVAAGDRVWLGVGESIASLDVADPDLPHVIGHLDTGGRVTSLARDGDRMFAGLLRVNVRVWEPPVPQVAVFDIAGDAPVERAHVPLGFEVANDLSANGAGVVALCALCRSPQLQAFALGTGDTLTPGAVVPIARHVRALAVTGTDVVLALGDGGLAALPRAAGDRTLAGLWDPPGPASDVVGDGEWLAWTTSLAPAEGFRAPDLEVVDAMADPLGRTAAWTAPHKPLPQPPRLGRLDLVDGAKGHLVAAGAGFWAIDLADRTAPVARVLVDRAVDDAVSDGGTAWLVEGGQIDGYDVRDPAAVRALGPLGGVKPVAGIELAADALVARLVDGPIAVFGRGAPDAAHPRGVFGREHTGVDGQAVLHGGALVVAEWQLDIAAWDGHGMPDVAERRASWNPGRSDAHGVTPDGGLVWIADGWQGVRVLDVTDPRRPALVARMRIAGEALRITLAGDRVLVAAGDGGVVVLRRTAFASRAWLPWAGAGD